MVGFAKNLFAMLTMNNFLVVIKILPLVIFLGFSSNYTSNALSTYANVGREYEKYQTSFIFFMYMALSFALYTYWDVLKEYIPMNAKEDMAEQSSIMSDLSSEAGQSSLLSNFGA